MQKWPPKNFNNKKKVEKDKTNQKCKENTTKSVERH